MNEHTTIHLGCMDEFRQFDSKWIEQSRNTILGIDRDFRIIMLNQAYFAFAVANSGENIASDFGIGTNILDAISGPQKVYYRELFASCFDKNEPTAHEYECSSPGVFRLLKLFIYPTSQKNVLLLDHAVIVEQSRQLNTISLSRDTYIDDHGTMHQCGHCRRVRHNDGSRWDWLNGAFDYPDVSHGICESCLATYYPDINIESE